MTARRKLHIGVSLSPTWLSGEGWRRPDSEVETLFDGSLAVNVARQAEAACADFVFCPDVPALQVERLESGPGFSCLDPTLLLSAVARHTTHIGLLTTMSTTFLPPYMVARQLQSLHRISNGRAGWNIVTALEGHRNFGLRAMPSAAARYDQAEEFTDLVLKLWQSYPASALHLDRGSGRFADTSRVAAIDHDGEHFQVQGPLDVPAHESPIPLVQAGASAEGKRFAARVADAIFASTPDQHTAQALRRELQALALSLGRPPMAVRLLPGLSLYLAHTREAALELFADTHRGDGRRRACATILALLGVDVSAWPADRPLLPADLPAGDFIPRSRTHAQLLMRRIHQERLTIDQLARCPEVMGSGHWQIIGTIDDAVQEIRTWIEAEAIDGFVALPGGSTESMQLALNGLLPRLSEDGLFRKRYSGTTFADHLTEP